MFEFTKEEQAKVSEVRRVYNEKNEKDGKIKMLGNMFGKKKKGDSGRGEASFNNSGNNTSK